MFSFGNDASLNSDHAPFLLKLQEEQDNCLHITVSLSYVGEEEEIPIDPSDHLLTDILSGARPICPSEEDIYEIVFEDYILYLTRNESYTSIDAREIRKGRYFTVFEKSTLLDILPQITDCQICADGSAYPGEWKHYGIITQYHIVDVVSCNEPVIRKIPPGKTEQTPQ
ncbi:MAG: hypothetical protein E7559_06165 [Ruminococcaceae bacterium]|nr:hypothetical protein [Oscillospiraceae bacterium]